MQEVLSSNCPGNGCRSCHLALFFRESVRAIDAGTDGVSLAEAHEFAMGALEALQRASPRSLAITLRHFAAVAAALHAGARPWSG